MNTTGTKVSELLALVQQDYRNNNRHTLYQVNLYINNQLMPEFGERVANYVRKSHVENYKEKRLNAGASTVTINRELAVLRRAFRLGVEEEAISKVPVIKLYPEPEPRDGYYEHEEFLRFQHTCRSIGVRKNFDGGVVADIVMFAYYSGWRLNECLGLRSDWIRLIERIAVLPGPKHKNKRPKIYPLEGQIWEMVARRLTEASPEGFLFHRNGKQVKDIRRMCKKVCGVAEIDNKFFFHNLRRSCTTNLNRAGVDRETGKKITGHQKDHIYSNYNQTSLNQLRDATRKVEEYLQISMQEKQADAGCSGTQELQEVTSENIELKGDLEARKQMMSDQISRDKPSTIKAFLDRLWRKFDHRGDK